MPLKTNSVGLEPTFATFDDASIHVSNRMDRNTILKTKSIGIPSQHLLPSNQTPTLVGRVSNDNSAISHSIVEELQQIEPEHFAAVEAAVEENHPIPPNYLIQVQALVGKILAQLNRIADKDRSQTEEMKIKYKKSVFEAAGMQRDLAWHNLKFAGVAFAASFLQFLSPHASDREIANMFARECCPKFGEMFGSSIQANMQQTNSLANLILQEYQAKSSKGNNDSSNKQELLDVLNKVLTSLKEASRAG